MNAQEMVQLAAQVTRDGALYRAIAREQSETGNSVAAIIRAALVDRYEDTILEAAGIRVVRREKGE